MNESLTLVRDFCKEALITYPQFYGKSKIIGSLRLPWLKSIPEGFNPTLTGDLVLNNITSIPKTFNPIVGGSLYLNGLTSIPKTFNPIVGYSLFLHNLNSVTSNFNPAVGGVLYLFNVTRIPKGFNPKVGICIYFNSSTSLPERLQSEYTISKDNIFSHICLQRTKPEAPIFWRDGKYIHVDGILTEVIEKKGNVYRIARLGSNRIFFLVTDGNGKWSHGETLKEAKEDLIFKLSEDIDITSYKNLTLKDKLTLENSIECYRAITGSCSAGVKDFCLRKSISKKKKLTIQEILTLTEGEYGHKAFKDFFDRAN